MSAGKWFMSVLLVAQVGLAIIAMFMDAYDRAAFHMAMATFMVVCERRA